MILDPYILYSFIFYNESDQAADKLAKAEFDEFVEGNNFRSILVTMFEVLP